MKKFIIFILFTTLMVPLVSLAVDDDMNQCTGAIFIDPGSENYPCFFMKNDGSRLEFNSPQDVLSEFGPPQPISTCGAEHDFGWVMCTVTTNVIKPLIGVVVALVFVYFVWGLIGYLTKSGDAKVREEAKGAMIYSVLLMFVIFSIWGIVRLLQAITSTAGAQNPPVPIIYPSNS